MRKLPELTLLCTRDACANIMGCNSSSQMGSAPPNANLPSKQAQAEERSQHTAGASSLSSGDRNSAAECGRAIVDE